MNIKHYNLQTLLNVLRSRTHPDINMEWIKKYIKHVDTKCTVDGDIAGFNLAERGRLIHKRHQDILNSRD